MGSPAPNATAAWLVGRDRERAAIDGLLAATGRGQSGCLVVRAGMGKTALLHYAIERAAGMAVGFDDRRGNETSSDNARD